jgi:hypothetical protein
MKTKKVKKKKNCVNFDTQRVLVGYHEEKKRKEGNKLCQF